jgi:hypothetical protein
VPVVLLAAAGLLAAPWWRHRRGLLALPTVAYVAAVVLSPWTESRMAVPVLPLVAHAFATAFGRIPSLLGAHGARPARQALVAAGLGVMTLQALHWRALTPEWDEYSLEYWKRWETLAMARAAGGVPLERAILAHTDSAAFALVTGRATQDLSPAEWKMSDPRVFLANGGAPVVLGPLMRSELLPGASALDGELAALAGPRTREAVSLGEYGLVLEWVGPPPPATAGAVGPDPVVPGRIHPRWMRLTPADRERLARAAIPDAPP